MTYEEFLRFSIMPRIEELERQLASLSGALKQFPAAEHGAATDDATDDETPADTTADLVVIILRDYPKGLDLDRIRAELQKRYSIHREKKILRSILDRWLESKTAHPKFRRVKPSTYALF